MRKLPTLTPEQRHAVAARFDRANQLLAAGKAREALPLLAFCCRLDPVNLSYRSALRVAQRSNSKPAGVVARLRIWLLSRRLRRAQRSAAWLEVLLHAEEVLTLDPGSAAAHGALADAFERLDLIDQAIWCLEQARPAGAFDRQLTVFYERRGSFTQAQALSQPLPPLLGAQVIEEQRLLSVIAEGPRLAKPHLELARLYRGAGQWLLARRTLEFALEKTGNDFDVALELAELEIEVFRQDLAMARTRPGMESLCEHLQREIDTRSLSLTQQRAARHPQEMQHQFDLGVHLLRAGQLEEALIAFAAVKTDKRFRWRSLTYAAYCHLNSRQWRLAEKCFAEALPLIPEGDPARLDVSQRLAECSARLCS